MPALLRSIAAFQEDYPSVLFDVLYVPELDLKASFEQAAAEGRGPTILIAPGEWGPEFFDAGYVADLGDIANASLLNTLNSAAVETAQYRGALLGVPVDIRGVVLYRNQSLVPRAPATFDELVSLSKAATRGSIFGAVLDRSFFFSGGNLFGLGGELMNVDGSPAFNNPVGLEWVNLLRDFEQAGPTDFLGDNDLNLFKEGRVGFIIEGTWKRVELAEAIGASNLVIDPWPVSGSGSMAGFVQTENIYLSPDALDDELQISWKFVEYLLSAPAQSAVANAGMIPAISGSPVNLAANELKIQDLLTSQAMLALVDGVAYPLTPEMPVYAQQMDVTLQQVFEGQFSPAAALQEAVEAVTSALASSQTTPVPAVDGTPVP